MADNDEDIDRLILELHSTSAPSPGPGDLTRLERWLRLLGGGLVPAAELLMVSYGARQHIRRNALQHLHQEITITRRSGSFTFEESLARLVKDGMVEWRDAHDRAAHVDEFEQLAPHVPPSHP